MPRRRRRSTAFTGDTVAVYEGAAAGTVVGINAFSADVNGPAVTYSPTGGFRPTAASRSTRTAASSPSTIRPRSISIRPPATPVVTVTASDGHGGTSSQNFSISVYDVAPAVPTDSNAAANSVTEGAVAGTAVGIHRDRVRHQWRRGALRADQQRQWPRSRSTPSSRRRHASPIPPRSTTRRRPATPYTVTVQASDGTRHELADLHHRGRRRGAGRRPADSNAARQHRRRSAPRPAPSSASPRRRTDVNGSAVTWSLTNSAGSAFTINSATGVVTVADPTKIDFETAPGHAYTVTAQASDGTLASSQNFTIAVTDVAPSTPVDSNAAANTVAEGAAASAPPSASRRPRRDINGPGRDLVADRRHLRRRLHHQCRDRRRHRSPIPPRSTTKPPPGHAYTITAQASDGTLTSSQTFTIARQQRGRSPRRSTAMPPPTPSARAQPAPRSASPRPSTRSSTARRLTYALIGDTSVGGFTINAAAPASSPWPTPDQIDFESPAGATPSRVNAQASAAATPSRARRPSHIAVIGRGAVDARSTPTRQPTRSSKAPPPAPRSASPRSSTDVNGRAVTYPPDRRHLRAAASPSMPPPASSPSPIHQDQLRDAPTRPRLHRHRAGQRRHAGAARRRFTIAVGDVAPSVPVDSNCRGQLGRGRRGQRLDRRHHRVVDRRQRPGRHLLAGRRHLRAAASPSMPRPASSPSPIPASSTYETAPRPRLHASPRRPATARWSARRRSPSRVTDVAPSTPVDSNAAAQYGAPKARPTARPSASPRPRPTSTAPP